MIDQGIIGYAKKLVSSNTHDAIHFLEEILLIESPLYNELMLHQKSFLRSQEDFNKGIINYDNFSVALNKISLALLHLIDDLNSNHTRDQQKIGKLYSQRKQKRADRLLRNTVVKIDDKKQNLRKRKLARSLFLPFVWIIIIVLLFIVIKIDGGDPIEFFALTPYNAVYYGFLSAFFIIVLIQVILSYLRNNGKLPRKIQQLQITLKGDFDEIVDGLFHALTDLKCKVTDYDAKQGIIEANIYNRKIKDWLFGNPIAVLVGERICIELKQENQEVHIHATSTSNTSLPMAHEGDIFGVHKKLNLRNLKRIQDAVIENLID